MVARKRIDYPFICTLPVLFTSVTTVGVTPKYFKYSANRQINKPMKELFDSSTNNVGQLYYCCHSNKLICSSLTEKKNYDMFTISPWQLSGARSLHLHELLISHLDYLTIGHCHSTDFFYEGELTVRELLHND
jgi:hypothetical protein